MDIIIPIVAILSIFVIFPGMVLHHVTQWRKQKTLMPDDERIMEDLWRSAKTMERRLDTLEALLETPDTDRDTPRPPRAPRSNYDT